VAQRSPLEREFQKADLPVIFVDDFRFTSEDLERWRRMAHEPIASPDDPRLKRSAYLRTD